MPQPVLGSFSFLDVPDVNGTLVLLNGGGTPSATSGLLSARPTAGTVGRLYVGSDTKTLYRDNGTTWDVIGSSAGGNSSMLSMYSGLSPYSSGTTTIPTSANTTPLITDGTQLWSQTVTPVSSGSHFMVSFATTVDSNTSNRLITLALFRGSVCINAQSVYITTSSHPTPGAVIYIDTPTTTSPITYSLRVGTNNSGTWYANGSTTTRYGGVSNTTWTILELA